MSNTHKIDFLLSDFRAIFNNIEWNLGTMVGIASIVINPKLINLNNAPLRIDVEGLDVDGFQCLGVALLEKGRMRRLNEIIAMAKRSLVCESLELAADFLVRASRIMCQGVDLYEKDQYFSVDIRELWNSNKGKARASKSANFPCPFFGLLPIALDAVRVRVAIDFSGSKNRGKNKSKNRGFWTP